jgi:hypothetical protein
MARVQVSDEIWAAYRAALGTNPVSVALGRLVEREVACRRRATVDDRDGIREAVNEARVVANELNALVARVERNGGRRPRPSQCVRRAGVPPVRELNPQGRI